MSTVIGVFRDVKTAEEAVRALRNKGFKDNEISIVAKDEQGQSRKRDMEIGNEMSTDTISDGTLGWCFRWSGRLISRCWSPCHTRNWSNCGAGPLAEVLSGAVTGGVAGGLIDLGIPEERGRQYEQELKKVVF